MFPWMIKYPYQNDEIINLDWVLKQIQEFRTTFESWSETIRQLQEGLEDISDWEARIVQLELITEQIPVIEKVLSDLANLHDADVNQLKLQIADLQTQINNLDIAALKVYVDSRDNELMADYNKKIYDNYVVTYSLFNGLKDRLIALAEVVANIDTKAFNPWPRTLEKVSLQQNINYAYADLADKVLTAEEYASLGLSANDYDTFEMLARDYSLNSKFITHLNYVYSPVYGFKQEINNVLTSIINFIKGTMSADDYSALDIDADGYSALNLSANEYYSYNSNPEGTVITGGNGLSAEQYSSLQIL